MGEQMMIGQEGMGGGVGLVALIHLGIVIWFVVFTVLVTLKLDKIIQLLEKKPF
ncbi:MAG: hypothetical protein KJ923_03200 [Candidatus Omnitrophica bacterium]|nr:hypothetical protein [Candidatus Omnitrophota bacterium]MBU1905987.1 hypothetical protein [Candidatus Omnitrophota bacterium]